MDSTNRNTALASAFVEELARSGMRRAVIAPGSRSTPLALALLRAPAIATTTVVDERSAGFFALGAAHGGGPPVAVVCTSGTAAANLHPAICEANEAGVPLLALTSDRPPELRAIGAGQTIDQLKLFGDAVRWFCEVGTHDADDAGLLHLRSTACRAFAIARGDPRPGPVHLNLAWRDPLGPEPRDGEVTAESELALRGRGERPLHAILSPAALPDPALLDELAERLAASPRGLIVAGRAPNRSHADAVAALARACGYPIIAEPTSGLRVGRHDRSLAVSAYEAIAREQPAALEPEAIVRFGDLVTSKPVRQWLGALDRLRQIVVDPDAGWNEPTRRGESIVRADPVALATGLAKRIGSAGNPEWSAAWLAAERAAREALAAELERLDEASEPGAHAALAELYSDGDAVYTASSMPIRDQEAFVPTGDRDVLFLANRGANGIDGLVSSGIGAAVATGRPTWIVTGDLGLHHDANALALLREADVPVRVVVLNNAGGGIFEFLPQAEQVSREEFEAIFGTPVGLDLAHLAAAYDVPYRRVERLPEIREAARATGLIEIPVDRRRNVEVHRRLAEAAGSAVRASLGREVG